MLRLFVLLLLAANGFFYAWSNGHLSQWGLVASSQRESFRLKEQIEPERIVIRQGERAIQPASEQGPATIATIIANAPLPTTTATTPTASVATICLTAGIFNDRQSFTIKQALNTNLPAVRWRFETVNVPARWIVYMGKYPSNQARDVKKTQLDQINVRYEVLTDGKLEPGLSLGSHPTQATANQALQVLVKKGVRTARVLQETPEQKGQILIVPSLDEANRAKLNALYANLASQLTGKPLQACKN